MATKLIINCAWWADGGCGCPSRPYGDRPSAGVCLNACASREPTTVGPATLGWHDVPEPASLAADEVALCALRLAEEWPPEWQDRIRAATLRMAGGRHVLKLAFYRATLKHRR